MVGVDDNTSIVSVCPEILTALFEEIGLNPKPEIYKIYPSGEAKFVFIPVIIGSILK